MIFGHGLSPGAQIPAHLEAFAAVWSALVGQRRHAAAWLVGSLKDKLLIFVAYFVVCLPTGRSLSLIACNHQTWSLLCSVGALPRLNDLQTGSQEHARVKVHKSILTFWPQPTSYHVCCPIYRLVLDPDLIHESSSLAKAFLHGETNELHPVAATSGPEQEGLPPRGSWIRSDRRAPLWEAPSLFIKNGFPSIFLLYIYIYISIHTCTYIYVYPGSTDSWYLNEIYFFRVLASRMRNWRPKGRASGVPTLQQPEAQGCCELTS